MTPPWNAQDWKAYLHSILLADLALKDRNPLLARQRLAECKPELRNWEWGYLSSPNEPEMLELTGSEPTFSPDGTRIAIRATNNSGRVFDTRTGKEVCTSPGTDMMFNRWVFSPDGAHFAAEFGGPVYDSQTGQVLFTLKAKASLRGIVGFHAPVFSPDHGQIADQCDDGTVRVCDHETGEEVLALKGQFILGEPAFSPDGADIAVACSDRHVRLYDAHTGKEILAFNAKPIFREDGRWIFHSHPLMFSPQRRPCRLEPSPGCGWRANLRCADGRRSPQTWSTPPAFGWRANLQCADGPRSTHHQADRAGSPPGVQSGLDADCRRAPSAPIPGWRQGTPRL